MSESSTANVAVSNEAIHRRLDGIDQMLIGLVPRPERLAISPGSHQYGLHLLADFHSWKSAAHSWASTPRSSATP